MKDAKDPDCMKDSCPFVKLVSVDQGGEHARVGVLDAVEVGLVGPTRLLPAAERSEQGGTGGRLIGAPQGAPHLGAREDE